MGYTSLTQPTFYVPLFNGTEEKTNEIIEHYEENTSTDTVGHGYSGYSMSNNAKNAYEKGAMPLSKWNKKNIIERIKSIVKNYDIPFDVSKLDKMTLKEIKDEYLKKDGYHHTSKFYNITDFYKIDIEKILENKEKTLSNNAIDPLYYDYINNQVTGEKVYLNINPELEKNKNDVVKPIKVALSNIEFKSKKFDKNKIKDFIFGKAKTSNEERKLFVTHKKTGLIVKINAATIDESLGKIKDYKDINKLHLLTNVKEIFENSEFILNYDDVKSGLQSQTYRFCSLVEINGKQYFALMTALDNLELKLYDFESFNKESTIKTIQQKQELQDSTNIIISDLIDFVKSKIVKKYNNDYRNAVKQNDKTIKLFQSAYHGGAKDFDNFDLSYALSGEGAMAHGYGVYTAKNREVSEEYRKTLAQSLKNAKYDGVPLSKTELTKLHYAISEKLYLKGKDEALKELELLRKQSEKNKDKEGFLGRSSREFLENYNGQLELLNSVDESKITVM